MDLRPDTGSGGVGASGGSGTGGGGLAAIEPLAWSVHPARARPVAAAAAVGVILALGATVRLSFGSTGWSLFAVAVLCVALARFFFPTRYAITPHGVEAHELLGRRMLAWSEVRRIVVAADAAWVSPYAAAQFRDRQRGVELVFGGQAEAVRIRLAAAARATGAALIELEGADGGRAGAGRAADGGVPDGD